MKSNTGHTASQQVLDYAPGGCRDQGVARRTARFYEISSLLGVATCVGAPIAAAVSNIEVYILRGKMIASEPLTVYIGAGAIAIGAVLVVGCMRHACKLSTKMEDEGFPLRTYLPSAPMNHTTRMSRLNRLAMRCAGVGMIGYIAGTSWVLIDQISK